MPDINRKFKRQLRLQNELGKTRIGMFVATEIPSLIRALEPLKKAPKRDLDVVEARLKEIRQKQKEFDRSARKFSKSLKTKLEHSPQALKELVNSLKRAGFKNIQHNFG